jgi:predicted esterase
MTHAFIHRFEPGDASRPVLLALHGTGGTEDDLVPLARAIDQRAAVLSPRGQVLEQGLPRFFRRLAEGVFDLEDLHARTRELAEFVDSAAGRYGFDRAKVVAVGYSNGANIAASLLLLKPGLLSGAILFRAMVPLVPDPMPPAADTPVFLSNGRRDPLMSADQTERLVALLRRSGATVTLAWQDAGHELTRPDVDQAREWLSVLA